MSRRYSRAPAQRGGCFVPWAESLTPSPRAAPTRRHRCLRVVLGDPLLYVNAAPCSTAPHCETGRSWSWRGTITRIEVERWPSIRASPPADMSVLLSAHAGTSGRRRFPASRWRPHLLGPARSDASPAGRASRRFGGAGLRGLGRGDQSGVRRRARRLAVDRPRAVRRNLLLHGNVHTRRSSGLLRGSAPRAVARPRARPAPGPRAQCGR
jgi:hypothetical protein